MISNDNNQTVREAIPGREERMRYFFDHASEGLVFHVDGRITDANPTLIRMLGSTTNELINSDVFQWLAPRDHDTVKQHMAEGSEEVYEITALHKSGEEIPIIVHPIETYVAGNRERLVTVQEIGVLKQEQLARRKIESKVHLLSNFDPQTNLPNRRLFKRWIVDMGELHHVEHHQFAVVHINIQRVEIINELFGHEAGDKLISHWAKRLRRGLRSSSSHLTARIGGSRFSVALPYIDDRRSVIRLLENLRAELDAPYLINGHHIDSIRSAYGIAFFPGDGIDAETLMNRAEVASRTAKHSSESIHCYANEMGSNTLDNFKMEAQLKGALERDELVLYYQPKVDTLTEKVVGYEALIRWFNSDDTLIYPSEFIPIAEETGGIVPIGEWVIWSACEHLARLQAIPGDTPKISINLSSQQFQQPNLVELVQHALTLFSINPGLLEIEVTESVVMGDVESAIDTLYKLKDLGLTISIDDFGTGYSSLSYLKRFPIDTLKVDRSFVTDITTNAQDKSITRAIIALAKSLDLKTVAEGVENTEQLKILREMGCDMIQGFLFGKPLSVEEAFQQ